MSDEHNSGAFDEREFEALGAKKRNAGTPLNRLSAPKDAPEIEIDPGRTPGSAEGERETIDEDLRIHSERKARRPGKAAHDLGRSPKRDRL